jgi:hypothetical protein
MKTHFLGLKYLNSLMWIRDPGWKKVGSATLAVYILRKVKNLKTFHIRPDPTVIFLSYRYLFENIL